MGVVLYGGVDPGLDGALVIQHPGGVFGVVDAPTETVEVKGRAAKTRRVYLPGELAARIRMALMDCGLARLHVAIELVSAQPPQRPRGQQSGKACHACGMDPDRMDGLLRMGSSSAFSLGEGLMLWKAVLAALGVSYQLVTPATWKREYGLAGKVEGGDSRLVAQQLFPRAAEFLKRKKDHNRADALLIGEWLRRRMATAGTVAGK